jgi:ATP-binding cassette subfamily B protein
MLLWSAAQGWALAWLILLIVQALLPVASVYLTRALVDRLVAAVGDGPTWSSLRPFVILAALLAGLVLLQDLLRGVTGWLRTAQAEWFTNYVNSLIHRQLLSADMAFYEWPEVYDHLHQARSEVGHRPVALIASLGGLLQNGVTLFAMGAVLIPYGLWLPVVLVVSTLPALYVVLHFTLRQHQWRLRTTPEERRTWYYSWVFTSGETVAEVRLFGLGGHFQRLYQTLRQRLRVERLRMASQQAVAELAAGALASLATVQWPGCSDGRSRGGQASAMWHCSIRHSSKASA